MVCDGWFLVLRSLCKRGWQMVSTTTTLWMVWRIYFLSPAIGTTTHYYASLPWQAFIQHIIQNQKPLFQKNPAPATFICQDILMEGVTIAKPQSQLNVYANVSSNNNPSKWIQWMLNMAIAPWHSHHLTSTTAPSWRPQAGNPPHFSVFIILGEIQAGTWGWNTHTKKWPTAQIETKKNAGEFFTVKQAHGEEDRLPSFSIRAFYWDKMRKGTWWPWSVPACLVHPTAPGSRNLRNHWCIIGW